MRYCTRVQRTSSDIDESDLLRAFDLSGQEDSALAIARYQHLIVPRLDSNKERIFGPGRQDNQTTSNKQQQDHGDRPRGQDGPSIPPTQCGGIPPHGTPTSSTTTPSVSLAPPFDDAHSFGKPHPFDATAEQQCWECRRPLVALEWEWIRSGHVPVHNSISPRLSIPPYTATGQQQQQLASAPPPF